MATLEQVFGISAHPVLSYTERTNVDGRFVDAIRGSHHIVVYGASKQGKTALRQKHVDEGRCVVYRCGPRSTPLAIYQTLLTEAGIQIAVSESKSEGLRGGAKAGWGLKCSLPWVGGGNAKGELSAEAEVQTLMTSEFIDVDLADAQVVGNMLKAANFNRFVVIENYHYLSHESQIDLAMDLKTYHEMGIRFLILGVWRESNLLFIHNHDLQDRISEIPVEPWEDRDFDSVINAGATQLRIGIPVPARDEFKRNSYGNVGLLQEFLKTFCQLNGVYETLDTPRELNGAGTVLETLRLKAEDQRGRLLSALQEISSKSRPERRAGRDDPLTLPYYLTQVLLTAPIEELRDGISRTHLLEKIRALHRRENKNTIRPNDVIHLTNRLPVLQEGRQAPFLYFVNEKLKIADAGLLFALARVDRELMRDEIIDPLYDYTDSDVSDSDEDPPLLR